MARHPAEALVYSAIGADAAEVARVLEQSSLSYPGLVNARPSSKLWSPHSAAVTPEGRTALLWACQMGHTEVVTVLLAQPDCDVNAADEEHMTPLLLALLNQHIALANLLLDQPGVHAGVQDTHGRCALLEAYSQGRLELVQRIMSNPTCGVNATDKRGTTLLMRVCEAAQRELIDQLLDLPDTRGLNLEAINKDGYTALTYASEKGHTDVVRTLLDDFRNTVPPAGSPGRLARTLAYTQSVYWGRLDTVKLLLQHPHSGVDVNMRDPLSNRPALALACSALHYDIMRLMLDQPGMDPNARASETSYTQLMEACRVGHLDVARLLLSHPDIDINVVVQGWLTALLLSVKSRRMDSVMLLLDQPGIDLYAGDKDKRVLLIFGIGSDPDYAAAMVWAGMRIPRFVRAHGAPDYLMKALDKRRAFALWALKQWAGHEAVAKLPPSVMRPLMRKCGLLLHVGTV